MDYKQISSFEKFIQNGKEAIETKKFSEALSFFNKAYDLNPDSSIACGFKGILRENLILLFNFV